MKERVVAVNARASIARVRQLIVLGPLLVGSTIAAAQTGSQYVYELQRKTPATSIDVDAEVEKMMEGLSAQGHSWDEIERNRAGMVRAFRHMKVGSTYRGVVSFLFDGERSFVRDAVGVANDGTTVDTYELFGGSLTWRDTAKEPAIVVLNGDKREHLIWFGHRRFLGHASALPSVSLPARFEKHPGSRAYRFPNGLVEVYVPISKRGAGERFDCFQQLDGAWLRVASYSLAGKEGQTTGPGRRVVVVTRFNPSGRVTVVETFRLAKLEQVTFPSFPPTLKRGRSVLDQRLERGQSMSYLWNGQLQQSDAMGKQDRLSSQAGSAALRACLGVSVGLVMVYFGLRSLHKARRAARARPGE